MLACKKDSVTDKPVVGGDENIEPEKLTLVGSVKDCETRTQHTDAGTGLSLGWTAGDKIGLYVLADGESQSVNLPYKAASEGARTSFVPVGDAAQWKDIYALHDFYVYYPYSGQAGDAHSGVTVSVPAAQVQGATGDAAHLADLDFMYARQEQMVMTDDGSVEFQFSHLFSVLEVTLSADRGSISTDEVIFRCQDEDEILAAEGATVNLSTGKIDYSKAETSNQISVKLASPVTLTASSAEKVWMQIIPGHGGKRFDVLAVVDGQEVLLGSKGIPASGIPTGVCAKLSMTLENGPVDLSAEGTANTYIINRAAEEYKFDARVKGNGKVQTIEWNSEDWKKLNVNVAFTDADLRIEPVSAGLVWYNNPQTASGEWLRQSPVDIESVELREDGYVYFQTPVAFVNGNALIAVYDAAGEILWSWNIWAVEDYNPDATAKTLGEYVMMDRNLGAMTGVEARTETDPIKAAWALGNYYQWGRKDPFPAANSMATGNLTWGLHTYTPVTELQKGSEGLMFSQKNTDNEMALGKELGAGFLIDEAVAETVKYPYKWATNGNGGGCTSPYMWMNSQGDNMKVSQQVGWRYLWGNMNCTDGVKTIYDPCPAGWMVPDAAAVGLAVGKASLTPAGYGAYSADYDLYFPYGGQRMAGFSGFSNISGQGTEMFLATSTVSEKAAPFRGVRTAAHNGAPIDRYTDAAVTTGNTYVGQGVQLRCVKEQKVTSVPVKDLHGPKAGFLGNSITEVWESRTKNPNFFKENGYVHNGHSGTCTSNFVQRFNYLSMLDCQVLVVCGGVNDISENTGYYIPLKDVFNNLRMIAYWAEMAGMKVIMPSTVPANAIWWKDAEWNANHPHVGQSVVDLNKKIKALTEQRGYIYCDYWSSMADEELGLKVEYSWTESDRVHPNGAGYAVMESLIKPCIDKALYEPDLIGGDGQLEDFEKVEL